MTLTSWIPQPRVSPPSYFPSCGSLLPPGPVSGHNGLTRQPWEPVPQDLFMDFLWSYFCFHALHNKQRGWRVLSAVDWTEGCVAVGDLEARDWKAEVGLGP